jgi:hypothetical protein
MNAKGSGDPAGWVELLVALTAALESVSLAVEDALELLTVREEEEEVVVVEVAVEEESRFRFFFFSGIDTYFSQRRQFRQLLVSAGSAWGPVLVRHFRPVLAP